MARGLAKLEGELARVGSWAATRRERQEAARYYLPGVWCSRQMMQGCERRAANPMRTAAQRARRPQRVQAAPRRGEGEGGGEGEDEKGERGEGSRGGGEGATREREAKYCGLEEEQD